MRSISFIKLGLLASVIVFACGPSAAQTVGHSMDTPVASLFPGAAQGLAMTSSRDGNNEVYVMDPDGSFQTRKTTTAAAFNDQRPDISPDGSEIAFASNRDGNFEIQIMNFDGSHFRQLTFTAAPVANSWPRWSPDGEWIAFQSGAGTNFQIFRIRPDGTDLTQVTNYPGINQFPAWSPDGTRLAIRRDTDIYLIDSADGSNPVRLTNEGTINQMTSFSPDGTQIAFMSTRAGYISVFVMNSDGSGQFNFTPRPDGYSGTWTSRAPAWSPNGQFIYFTAQRSVETGNSTEQVYIKPAVGGAETRLTVVGANSEASVRRIVAPTIAALWATPSVLWPPDNEFVSVFLTVSVSDNSDPAPVCRISEVTANEEVTESDWQITGPLTLDLLSQRHGQGTGRIYTITVMCTNSSDLSSSATVKVRVPHDQRKFKGRPF